MFGGDVFFNRSRSTYFEFAKKLFSSGAGTSGYYRTQDMLQPNNLLSSQYLTATIAATAVTVVTATTVVFSQGKHLKESTCCYRHELLLLSADLDLYIMYVNTGDLVPIKIVEKFSKIKKIKVNYSFFNSAFENACQ